MRSVRLLCLIIIVSGCTIDNGVRPIWVEKLNGSIDSTHNSVEYIKDYYFTDYSRNAINNIHCYYGLTISGSYVTGVNFITTLFGLAHGLNSRACIISPKSLEKWGAEVILHEYIHHLDDIGRDGFTSYINVNEFVSAYERMKSEPKWVGLVEFVESKSDKLITNMFGIGYMAEHIAYVGARMAITGQGPNYMWRVFRKVFRPHVELPKNDNPAPLWQPSMAGATFRVFAESVE